jgi:hypothetical protein
MPKRTPLAVAAVLVALTAACVAASAASASVYCIDDTPATLADNLGVDASCETGVETIVAALTDAEGHAGPDTVLVGPGEFTLAPASLPSKIEAYYNGNGENSLQLRGAGSGLTQLTMGSTESSQKGIWINAPAGSTVSDLGLTIPANADGGGDIGFVFSLGVLAEGLNVDGPAATNATAIVLGAGGPVLRDSTVAMPIEASPSNSAVGATSGGTVKILDSRLAATTGVYSSGGSVTVERSTVDARTGSTTDAGAVFWRDSLIELGNRANAVGVQAANFNNSPSAIEGTIDGVTIAGGGGGSVGVRAVADSGQETTMVSLANSIIEGPGKSLQVWADNGRSASLAASYSNYNQGTVQVLDDLDGKEEKGTAAYTTDQVTSLSPSFVDAAGADFRLTPASPLLDAGDPAAPAAERHDLDGNVRAISAACPPIAARRDIGAYELDPGCVEAPAEPEDQPAGGPPGGAALPETTVRGPRRVAVAREWARVRLRFGSTQPGASFRCQVDSLPARSCAAAPSLRLRRGRHVVRVQAVTAAGADPTPAKIRVRVVAKKPPAAVGVHNR